MGRVRFSAGSSAAFCKLRKASIGKLIFDSAIHITILFETCRNPPLLFLRSMYATGLLRLPVPGPERCPHQPTAVILHSYALLPVSSLPAGYYPFLLLFPPFQVLLILAYDDPLLLSQIIYSHFPNYDLDLACISGGVTVLEWKMFYVITSLCLSVFPIYIIICYCRRGIIQKLETRWNEMTEKTRKIHVTLLHVSLYSQETSPFQALTFQATLPAIFTVAVAVFALGALNIYNHPLLEYSTFAIVSLIPASAPLGTLYFIRPYNEWIQERLPGQRRKITSSACPSVPSIAAVERK